MANELIAKIQNNPNYNENLHSCLIEVIEKEYSPKQLRVMQDDPIVSDSLLRGMVDSINTFAAMNEVDETASRQELLQQARDLMRKSLGFLNRRAQDTYDEQVELPRAA